MNPNLEDFLHSEMYTADWAPVAKHPVLQKHAYEDLFKKGNLKG